MPYMINPALPGQTITVSDHGVALRERAGWTVTDEPPAKKTPKPLRRQPLDAEPPAEPNEDPAPDLNLDPAPDPEVPPAESGDTTKET